MCPIISQEIRFDYDRGFKGSYWQDCPPKETDWRCQRKQPPPARPLPTPLTPALGVLPAIQDSFKAKLSDGVLRGTNGRPLPKELERALSLCMGVDAVLPWSGDRDGGDARMLELVPVLEERGELTWPLVATHVPGRSAAECETRWAVLHGHATPGLQ